MDERMFRQALAEVMEINGMALGLVMKSIARQTDAEKLTASLRATLAAAKATGESPAAIRIATYALAAAEAESIHQQQPQPKH